MATTVTTEAEEKDDIENSVWRSVLPTTGGCRFGEPGEPGERLESSGVWRYLPANVLETLAEPSAHNFAKRRAGATDVQPLGAHSPFNSVALLQ